MRTRTGRPHWIVLDEAHHMLPGAWAHLGRALPHSLGETVLVTVHPDHLAAVAGRRDNRGGACAGQDRQVVHHCDRSYSRMA
jgi:hypothetical protein